MFKKCLKYDLRAFGKIWLLAAAVVLAITLLGSVGIGNLVYAFGELVSITQETNPDAQPDIWFFTKFFIGLICMVAVISASAVFLLGTEIAICLRYYNHLFTDQGYLTFTLPVKRSTLFWSKTVSGYMFMAGSFLMYFVMLGCVLLSVGIGIVGVGFRQVMLENGWTFAEMLSQLWASLFEDLTWALLWEGFTILLAEIDALNILRVALIAILVLANGLAGMFTSLMLSYACVTLGATMFRKLKLLSVLITYYVVNNVLTVPVVYFSSYYGMFAAMIGTMALPKLFENLHVGMSVIYLALNIMVLAQLCVGIALAIFNVTRIERKLNLA